MKVPTPPISFAKKLSKIGKKISEDCRTCPILEFEFTCAGFKETFMKAYGNSDPKPCPRPFVILGKIGNFLLRKFFDGLHDCQVCDLRDFCLASCDAFKTMYVRAYK